MKSHYNLLSVLWVGICALLYQFNLYGQSQAIQLWTKTTSNTLLQAEIQAVKAEITPVGRYIFTHLELAFSSKDTINRQAVFILKDIEAHQIRRFAVKMDSAWVEAAVLESTRQDYQIEEDQELTENIFGQNIAPHFSYTIQQLHPASTQKIIVDYTTEMLYDGKQWQYTLPLPLLKTLQQLQIDVVSSIQPNFQLSGIQTFVVEKPTPKQPKQEQVYTFKAQSIAVNQPFIFGFPVVITPNAWVGRQPHQPFDYFYAEVPACEVELKEKELPKKIVLFYDQSLSAKQRNREAELNFLNRYLKKIGDTELEVVGFSHDVVATKTFRIEEGGFQEVRKYLQQLELDGGTNLGCLQFGQYEADEFLLLTDGYNNFGKMQLSKSLSKPIIWINSRQKDKNITSLTHLSSLYEVVSLSGGQLVDLSKLSVNDALKQLLTPVCQFLGVDYAKDEISNLQVQRTPQATIIVGKLLKEMSELRLKFGRKGKVQIVKPLGIQRTSAYKGQFIENIWASVELKHLLKTHDSNSKIVKELSKQHNIAIQGMTWVLPETLADYLHYGITPPFHLSTLYKKELSHSQHWTAQQHKYEEEDGAESAFKLVANLYAQRRSWYEKDFSNDDQDEKEYGRTDFTHKETGEDGGFFWSIEEVLSDSAKTAQPSPKQVQAPKILEFMAHQQYIFANPPLSMSLNSENDYWSELENAKDSVQLLKQYRILREKHGNQAEFYIGVANLFFEKGSKNLALKTLSNITELFSNNFTQLTTIAKQLVVMQRHELALPIYEKMLAMNPHNPHLYRELAWCYVAIGEKQKAIDYLYEVVANKWESKYMSLQAICIGEINYLLANSTQKLNIQHMPSELRKPMPLDVRVVLEWDNPAVDLDLYIIEPTDEKAYYANTTTQIGGSLSIHSSSGLYNPEEYLLKNAQQGDYIVEIHRYIPKKGATNLHTTTATLTYYLNYGRPNEEKKVYQYQVAPTQQYVDAAVLHFAAHTTQKDKLESRYQTIKSKQDVQLVSRSGDNQYIALAHDYDISIYGADSTQLLKTIKDVSVGGVSFKKMVFNSQGTHLLVLGDSTLINLDNEDEVWEDQWDEEGHISVIKLIDLQKGVLQKNFAIVDSVIHQVEFLADGKGFLAVGVNGISRIDILSGGIEKNIIRPTNGKFIASATSSQFLATAERGKITLRHLPNLQIIKEIYADSAIDLQVAQTGTTLAFLQWEKNRHNAYIVQWADNQQIRTVTFDLYYQTGIPKIGVFSLSPDARFVAAQPYGTNQVFVKAIYEQTEDLLDYYHHNLITAIAFSQDGNFLTSASKDNVVRTRDMRKLPFSTIKTYGNEFDFDIDANGTVLSIAEDNSLKVYQKEQATLPRFNAHRQALDSLLAATTTSMSRVLVSSYKDQNYAICLSKVQKKTVWQVLPLSTPLGLHITLKNKFVQQLQIPLEVFGEKYPLQQNTLVTASPDGKSLAFNEDTLIRILQIKKLKKSVINDYLLDFYQQKCMRTLTGHDEDSDKQHLEKPKNQAAILDLQFSHDGKYLLSKGVDRTVRVWNVKTGECLATYTLLHEASATLKFSAHDEWVLFEDKEYHIKVWDWKTNTIVGELVGHKAPITSIDVDKTGKYFLSSSKDHSIRLWNAQSLNCVKTFYDDTPRKVKFCNPQTFASAGQDTYVKLWKIE